MKMKNKNIMVGLTVLSALFASCSSSDMAEDNPGVGKKVDVTFNAGIGADSRMVMTDNGVGNGISNVWATGDQIGVVDAANSKNCTCTETSISSTDQHQARFHGEIDAISEDDQLYAYYPASSVNGTTATFDISAQTGALNGTTGLEMTAPRYAAAKYKSDGTTSFDFTNATCILSIQMKFPKQMTIKTVKLSGTGLINKYAYTNGTGTPTTGDIVITLNGTTGIQTDANGNLATYANIFGQTLSAGLLFTAESTDGNEYLYYLNQNSAGSAVSFISGKTYRINSSKAEFAGVNIGYDGYYYKWDAASSYPTAQNSSTNNTSPTTDFTNVASNSCKNCISYNEATWYLKGDPYWDANGPKCTVHTPTGDVTVTKGMWIKKKAYISGFTSASASGVDVATGVTPKTGKPTDLTQYFFLPAISNDYNNSIDFTNNTGLYWTKTPGSSTAYSFWTEYNLVKLQTNTDRASGRGLMVLQ